MRMQTLLDTIMSNLELTREEVADKLDVKNISVSGYYTGVRRPSVETGKKIMKLAWKAGLDINLQDVYE